MSGLQLHFLNKIPQKIHFQKFLYYVGPCFSVLVFFLCYAVVALPGVSMVLYNWKNQFLQVARKPQEKQILGHLPLYLPLYYICCSLLMFSRYARWNTEIFISLHVFTQGGGLGKIGIWFGALSRNFRDSQISGKLAKSNSDFWRTTPSSRGFRKGMVFQV